MRADEAAPKPEPPRRPPSFGFLPVRGATVFAALCIVILLANVVAWQVTYWVGHQELALCVHAIDDASATGLASAEVVIFRGYVDNPAWRPEPSDSDPETRRATTGSDGSAILLCPFTVCGQHSLFHKKDRVEFADKYVRMSVGGYRTETRRLGELLGESRDLRDSSRLDIVIELSPEDVDPAN